MHAYQKGTIIGEGTYGSVICATHKATGRQVAIKKVRLSSNGKDGLNMSVLRELKALRSLAAPHIVDLLDTFSTKSSLVLVFEFMEWSLEDVIRDKSQTLSDADVKSYMQMMLQALAHVHSHQAIHRDIKPDNLLISSNGQLKLADFGLARFLKADTDSPDSSTNGKLTPQVFGRWYRPPELLMGSSKYRYGVDMWAAGCVFAELLLRKPWFPGNCDMDQLDRVFKVLGVPTPQTWPGYADLPHRIDFKPAPGQPLASVFKQAPPEALDLLQHLMAFDPEQRISAAEALAHPYFTSQPAPTAPAQLPRPATTRLNSLGVTRVPAVIPDMLMPHRLLQQQQQGFSTAGIAAAGWADAGEAGEALPMQHQQRNQQQEGLQAPAAAAGRSNLAGMATRPSQAGSGTSRLLAFSDAPSFSGRFLLGQGLLPAEQHQPHQQQQQHQQQDTLQQLERQLQGQPPVQQQQGEAHARHAAQSETGELDHEQEMPWKGRLSFGGILDEPTPPSSTTHAGAGAAAVGAGDENTVPAGLTAATALQQQQQQQHAYRRPSPIVGSCQQQKGTANQPSNSSLRPPLHPSTTPVHLRTGHHGASTAAGGGGGGDDRMSQQQQQQHRQGGSMMPSDAGMAVASRQRRSVSDLSAALSSAAAAAAPVGAAGLLNPLAPLLGIPRVNQQQQHQHHSVLEGHPVSAGCMQLPASTPAAAAARGDAAASAAEAPGGDGVAGADVDTACPMSLGTSARKRSRTVFEVAPAEGPAAAGTEQQQQQGANGGDAAMLFSSDRRVVRGRRSSITSGCCSMETDAPEGQAAAGADGHVGQQQHGAAGGLAGPVGQLSAEDRSMSITSDCMHADMAGALAQHQHQQRELQQQQRGLQELSDMPPPHAVQPRAAAAAAAAGTGPESHAHGQHGAPGNSSSGHASLPGSGGSTCPMSLDHRASTAARQHSQQQPGSSAQQQQPTGSGAGLQGLEGLSSGDLVTGGRPAADELRSMDPAELAELAKFWRPRLDSAERRYLRCRTMQLGEALLQASQPDDASEDLEYHRFPGMDSPSGGGLFDMPVHGHDQQQQQERLELQDGAHPVGQWTQQQLQQQLGRGNTGAGLPAEAFVSPTGLAAAGGGGGGQPVQGAAGQVDWRTLGQDGQPGQIAAMAAGAAATAAGSDGNGSNAGEAAHGVASGLPLGFVAAAAAPQHQVLHDDHDTQGQSIAATAATFTAA